MDTSINILEQIFYELLDLIFCHFFHHIFCHISIIISLHSSSLLSTFWQSWRTLQYFSLDSYIYRVPSVRMFDCDIRYTQFKIIFGPIFELWFLFGSFFRNVEVRKENQGCITSNEDKNMPYAVHVGEIYGEPRVAEHSINDPTEQCQKQHSKAAEPQAVHASALHPVKAIKV